MAVSSGKHEVEGQIRLATYARTMTLLATICDSIICLSQIFRYNYHVLTPQLPNIAYKDGSYQSEWPPFVGHLIPLINHVATITTADCCTVCMDH